MKTLNEQIQEIEKNFPVYQSALINEAMWFASKAHKEARQLRKYTGLPYITHPMEVARIVEENGGDEASIAAAWLHDVVEDTAYTLEDIEALFGCEVAELVNGLTKPCTEADGDRPYRNARYAEHLSAQGARVQTIKTADILHNSATVVEANRDFATRWVPENIYFSSLLVNACPVLRGRLAAQLESKADQLANS